MGRPNRASEGGVIYHVLNRANAKMTIFEKDKEMVQVFEGVILAIKGRQSSSPMMTVRKVSHGVGVELVLPMHSPIVKKIEIVKKAKSKRSKLYYIRDKSAKSLKMKFGQGSWL